MTATDQPKTYRYKDHAPWLIRTSADLVPADVWASVSHQGILDAIFIEVDGGCYGLLLRDAGQSILNAKRRTREEAQAVIRSLLLAIHETQMANCKDYPQTTEVEADYEQVEIALDAWEAASAATKRAWELADTCEDCGGKLVPPIHNFAAD